MDCPQALTLANAWIDGESIPAEDHAALEAHLAGCAECRATVDGLRLDDADLRKAFSPLRGRSDDLAQRVIASLDPPQPTVRSRPTWVLLLAATAAGYLIAIFTWNPSPREEPLGQLPAPLPIARLAVATGPVEYQPPKDLQWYTCPTEKELHSGVALRTEAGSRCEVSTRDGSQVRLSGDTEVQFPGVRQVDLSRGQLWSNVAGGGSPFSVKCPEAKVVADGGTFNFSCQPGRTVVTVVAGSARVESGDQTATIEAGQSATIAEGRVSEVRRVNDTMLTTAWINELLAMKGPDDPEFTTRMNDILAQLGQTKLAYLYEEEIRRLGDHCVLPLVRFLESSRSQGDETKRLRAASIVADVAQPRSIPLLIELLADENPQVRYHAARGLERLTTRDHGRPPEAWQTENWASCAPTYQAWQEWWEANRGRYPGAIELKRPLLKKG